MRTAVLNSDIFSNLLLGPRLDFDPDIVAALDDDFDFDNPDNLLEDDFIVKANVPGSIEQEKEVG